MADEDLAASELAPAVAETAGEFSEVGAAAYPEPMIASFAAGALARDLVIAGSLDATVQVTSLFEPLMVAESGRIRRSPSGQAALGIVVPHVARLRWDTIMEFREHPGSRDTRARLREIEERAMTEDPADALEFQQRVSQEVTNELFAVIDDLEGKRRARPGTTRGGLRSFARPTRLRDCGNRRDVICCHPAAADVARSACEAADCPAPAVAINRRVRRSSRSIRDACTRRRRRSGPTPPRASQRPGPADSALKTAAKLGHTTHRSMHRCLVADALAGCELRASQTRWRGAALR